MTEKIEWYKEVLELEPNSKVFFPLAKLLAAENESEEAVSVLQKGLERHHDFLEARLFLIELLHKSRRTEECDTEVRKLAKLFASYAGFWQAWAACLEGKKDEQDTASMLRFLAAGFLHGPLSLSEVLNRGLDAITRETVAQKAETASLRQGEARQDIPSGDSGECAPEGSSANAPDEDGVPEKPLQEDSPANIPLQMAPEKGDEASDEQDEQDSQNLGLMAENLEERQDSRDNDLPRPEEPSLESREAETELTAETVGARSEDLPAEAGPLTAEVPEVQAEKTPETGQMAENAAEREEPVEPEEALAVEACGDAEAAQTVEAAPEEIAGEQALSAADRQPDAPESMEEPEVITAGSFEAQAEENALPPESIAEEISCAEATPTGEIEATPRREINHEASEEIQAEPKEHGEAEAFAETGESGTQEVTCDEALSTLAEQPETRQNQEVPEELPAEEIHNAQPSRVVSTIDAENGEMSRAEGSPAEEMALVGQQEIHEDTQAGPIETMTADQKPARTSEEAPDSQAPEADATQSTENREGHSHLQTESFKPEQEEIDEDPGVSHDQPEELNEPLEDGRSGNMTEVKALESEDDRQMGLENQGETEIPEAISTAQATTGPGDEAVTENPADESGVALEDGNSIISTSHDEIRTTTTEEGQPTNFLGKATTVSEELALEDDQNEALPATENNIETGADHQESLIGDGNSLKEIFEQNIENEDNQVVDTSSLPVAETTAHPQSVMTENADTVFHAGATTEKLSEAGEDIGAEGEAYRPKFEDTGPQYTLRTRSMAEVLAEQDDPRGAMEIYRELLAGADNPVEKSDLQSRIETLSQKLSQAEETPPARDYETANPAPKSKAKLISMLEALAQRVEARMQG